MDEYHRIAGFQPACVTGKPLGLFGVAGRAEAPGRDVAQIAAATLGVAGKPVKGARVALQGFGNVGRHAARRVFGARNTDCCGRGRYWRRPRPRWSRRWALSSLESLSEPVSAAEVLTVDCDVLIPAALEA